jgi:hypothetical protein
MSGFRVAKQPDQLLSQNLNVLGSKHYVTDYADQSVTVSKRGVNVYIYV